MPFFETDVKGILEEYRNDPTKTRLHLQAISPEQMNLVIEFLNTNNTVKSLCISDIQHRHQAINIGVANTLIIALAKSLRTNTVLTTLSLINIKFGDEGAIALAEVLTENKTITSLSLKENNIDDKGANALAESLSLNNKLVELDLSENDIGNEGTASFIKVLKSNRTLTELNLGENCDTEDESSAITGLSTEAKIDLIEVIKINSTIKVIMLSDSEVDNTTAVALADALQSNSTLIDLNVITNNEEADSRIFSYLDRNEKSLNKKKQYEKDATTNGHLDSDDAKNKARTNLDGSKSLAPNHGLDKDKPSPPAPKTCCRCVVM